MKMRDVLGILLLAVAITGMFGGLAAVARDLVVGWASVAGGVVLAALAYRMLRSEATIDGAEEEDEVAPPAVDTGSAE